jgi:hypothetical protein
LGAALRLSIAPLLAFGKDKKYDYETKENIYDKTDPDKKKEGERPDYSEIVKYSKTLEMKGEKRKYSLKAGKLKEKDIDESLRAYSFKKEEEVKDEKRNSISRIDTPPTTKFLSYDDTLPDIWEIVNIEVEEI